MMANFHMYIEAVFGIEVAITDGADVVTCTGAVTDMVMHGTLDTFCYSTVRA
jgi:hypothetical protein